MQTNQLTPWSGVLKKQLVPQLVEKVPEFYRSQRSMFTGAYHLSLSWTRWIQSMPSHTVSLRSILLYPLYLSLGFPSSLFPWDFTANTLYASLFSTMHATWSTHLIVLDMIYLLIYDNEYKSWTSHYAVLFCFLLLPVSETQMFLSHLFSNTLQILSFC